MSPQFFGAQCGQLTRDGEIRLTSVPVRNVVGLKAKIKMWRSYTERRLYRLSNLLDFFSELPILNQLRQISSHKDPRSVPIRQLLLGKKIRPRKPFCLHRSRWWLKVVQAFPWMVYLVSSSICAPNKQGLEIPAWALPPDRGLGRSTRSFMASRISIHVLQNSACDSTPAILSSPFYSRLPSVKPMGYGFPHPLTYFLLLSFF